MFDQERVDLFHQNGFVNGGFVLSDAEVEELRGDLQTVIDNYEKKDVPQPVRLSNLGGDASRPVWQIVNIWEASNAFSRLIKNPAIVEKVAQLMKAKELRVWHDQIQYKPAQEGGTNHWHQDSPKWRTLAPKLSQVSAWVALDEVDESNGCMRMVPGSHRWGNLDRTLSQLGKGNDPPSDFEGHQVEMVSCPVEKGHVHFHHAMTWHGSGPNQSQRPRRAIAIHFMTEETVYDAEGEHLMKQFIRVPHGAKLEGKHFPQVWPL